MDERRRVADGGGVGKRGGGGRADRHRPRIDGQRPGRPRGPSRRWAVRGGRWAGGRRGCVRCRSTGLAVPARWRRAAIACAGRLRRDRRPGGGRGHRARGRGDSRSAARHRRAVGCCWARRERQRGGARADAQAGGAGDPLVGRPLVGGLRARSDARRAGAGRERRAGPLARDLGGDRRVDDRRGAVLRAAIRAYPHGGGSYGRRRARPSSARPSDPTSATSSPASRHRGSNSCTTAPRVGDGAATPTGSGDRPPPRGGRRGITPGSRGRPGTASRGAGGSRRRPRRDASAPPAGRPPHGPAACRSRTAA